MSPKRRDARVVEEARLESVYTPKGYPGFESPSLRRLTNRFYYFFLLLSLICRFVGINADDQFKIDVYQLLHDNGEAQ